MSHGHIPLTAFVVALGCLIFAACESGDTPENAIIVVEDDAEPAPSDGLATMDTGTTIGDAVVDVRDAALSEADMESNLTGRRVLHEVFSGSNCAPCLESDESIKEVLNTHPDNFTAIKYQIGSDPYLSREAIARRMSYLPPEAETYGIPYVHADGVNGFHPNEVNDDQGYLVADYERFLSVEAHMKLGVAHTLTGQTLRADVNVEPLMDFQSENLRLYIAIIENRTFNNVGSNGQTEFAWVFKKFIPDGDGIPLASLTAFESQSISQSYTFNGVYTDETGIRRPVNHAREHTVEEFEDLSVVVFVQDADGREVLQSAWSTPEEPDDLGVVAGRVLDTLGHPIVDQPVTCCDDEECQTGRTDEEGRYRFTGLTYNPRKVDILGPDGTMDVFLAQEVGMFRPEIKVELPSVNEDWTPLPSMSGGTAILAEGALRITAPPGAIEYGVGVDNALRATQVELSRLPPFTLGAHTPAVWSLPNAQAAAFIINPLKVTSRSPIPIAMNEAIAGFSPSTADTVYDLYSVDVDTALARPVGEARADANGWVRANENAAITALGAYIFVRRPEGP